MPLSRAALAFDHEIKLGGLCASCPAYRFANTTASVYVAWTPSHLLDHVSVKMPVTEAVGTTFDVIDYVGRPANATAVVSSDGKLALKLTNDPVYLVVRA